MVNDDGSILLTKTYNNVVYTVISTEITGRGRFNCLDTIKNSKGTILTKSREEWQKLFKKYE